MLTQADIDALTAKVDEYEENLVADKAAIQTELDSLQQQIDAGTSSGDLDLTGLTTAVGNLGNTIGEVGDLKPAEAPTSTGAVEQAPTKPNGTATEETEDPEEAARRAV